MVRAAIVPLVIVGLLLDTPVSAGELAEADARHAAGEFEAALALCEKALSAAPENYAALWQAARACRELGDRAKRRQAEGWKETCARRGKAGMQYAARAMALEPERPDGHYYFGLNVGTYSDGVSVFTALREGLKDKTQKSFEKAYRLDRMYHRAGPVLSLARFWAVLPWPLNDRKKSLAYHREYQQTPYFNHNAEAHFFLGELLRQMGGEENRAESRRWLEKAAASADAYYRDRARKLLEK